MPLVSDGDAGVKKWVRPVKELTGAVSRLLDVAVKIAGGLMHSHILKEKEALRMKKA